MPDDMSSPRVAGVTIPLFSIRTKSDWGIGQITDMPACGAWIVRAGHRLLQILPPYELCAGETSPYGARTAFGLDPIYITLEAVEDLDSAAIAEVLGAEGLRQLERVRSSPTVDYKTVRALKGRVLHHAFERFHAREWLRGTARADALRAFVQAEKAWADDLALYVALRDAHEGIGWEQWPEGERERRPESLATAREELRERVLEHQYGQWIAHTQWDRARHELRAMGVELMGDMPFVVGAESADVWARASQFKRHLSLGAPPDGFTPEGQDWGLPPYDWEAMDQDNLAWLRARTRHAARLYDRFRLDHVVGYFRMWVREPGHKGYFDPDGEGAQRVRGERVLGAIIEEAAPTRVIAEDLGVIPPFVRETMQRLGLPGYRVIPWEKGDDGRFRDPLGFSPSSVATFSTHDTLPITAWWGELSEHDRAQLAGICGIAPSAPDGVRDRALMSKLLASGSSLSLALAPELLGEHARINTPGTVDETNWTYRLPLPLEDLLKDPGANERLAWLNEMAMSTGRAPTL